MSSKHDSRRDVSESESEDESEEQQPVRGKGGKRADDDEFEFEQFTETKKPTKVSDRPYDEAVDVSEDDDSVASPQTSPKPVTTQQRPNPTQQQQPAARAAPKPAPAQQHYSDEEEEDEDEDEEESEEEESPKAKQPQKSQQPMAKPMPSAAGASQQPRAAPTQQLGKAAAPAPKPAMAEKQSESEESESESEEESAVRQPSQAKLYNPADYKHLVVSSEIQDLFDYIGRHKPADIELDTKMKPFIPDFIPAIGEIDAFLKVPAPDDKKDDLGLVTLDEPAAQQSDPTVLDLQLRVVSKTFNQKPVTVRSIENADKHPKKITKWVQNIEEVHRQKPPPNVHYSRPMPEIETLMQAWPHEFEELLKSTALPSADLDLDVQEFSRLVCAILDIPVYDKTVESLHVLFTLYSDFKNNAHFQHQEH